MSTILDVYYKHLSFEPMATCCDLVSHINLQFISRYLRKITAESVTEGFCCFVVVLFLIVVLFLVGFFFV